MDFDLLVHEAWPAYEQRTYDGWILRYAGGVTKRANSGLALGRPADLAGAIEAAEAFYAEKGQRSVFSVGVGAMPGLDDELAARGYGVVDPTVIMVGDGVHGCCRSVRGGGAALAGMAGDLVGRGRALRRGRRGG